MTCTSQRPIAASVVVCAYNERDRIANALDSLRAQDTSESFEVIAVVSGADGCARFVAADYPEVVLRSCEARIYPGAARNKGIAAARGEIIAFLPADGVASASWLSARLACHRSGHRVVGGSVTNATPLHPVGTASHMVEYAVSLPRLSILNRQSIPHTLSYHRSVFAELGTFPELDVPGEDTVFNRRCVQSGIAAGFAPRAMVAHRSPTTVRRFVAHQREHGRGLARCVADHGLGAPFTLCNSKARRALSVFIRYPAWRWYRTLVLFGRCAPLYALEFLVLSPFVILGYVAGAVGVWDVVKANENDAPST